MTVDSAGEDSQAIVLRETAAVIERSYQDQSAGQPFITGISGADLSGKTTFAEHLSDLLKRREHDVQLIHLDDFLNPRAVRSSGEDEIDSYIRNAFNLSLLISELLKPARQGATVDCCLKLLDLDTDRLDRSLHYRIHSNTVVLIEGVLLFRDPLNRFLDYRIFLEISSDEILRRAERRDIDRFGSQILEKYRRKYLPVHEWHLRTHEPEKQSNLVINNEHLQRPVITRPGIH